MASCRPAGSNRECCDDDNSGVDVVDINPICPYCGAFSQRVTGKTIYPHRPDLYKKWFYCCTPCDAYVGCHPGSRKPLGRLADAELRKAKSKAHAAFDPLWKSKEMKRGQAYKWLADSLGIAQQDCHIGMFDTETCARVVAICENRRLVNYE